MSATPIILCPRCKRKNLLFRWGDAIDYSSGVGVIHSEVVEIICQAVGTGYLSQCSFIKGSEVFAALTRLYLVMIEKDRADGETESKFAGKVQLATFDVVDAIANERIAEIPHLPKDDGEDMIEFEPIGKAGWSLDHDKQKEEPPPEEPKE